MELMEVGIYKKALDLYMNFKVSSSYYELFNYIQTYLKEEFNTSDLFVFSYPQNKLTNKKSTVSKNYRTVWNKKEVEAYSYDIKTLLGRVTKFGIEEERIGIVELDDNKFFYFLIGINSDQMFFGLFKSDDFPENIRNVFLQFVANSFGIISQLRKLENLGHLVLVDDVTGLYNQRKLQLDLRSSIDKYEKNGEGFSVLFIDIDHFKNVNDGHGHLVGTCLLAELASKLREVLRESDMIYRYGGDEFVMIVEGTKALEARLIGERILKGVQTNDFKINKVDTLKLSVSIGIAQFPEDAKNSDDILAFADQMMYQAKHKGRGTVCLANELFKK